MTTPGAVALTALVVLVGSLVTGVSADGRGISYRQQRDRTRVAWVLFTLALFGFIVAIWLEALR